MGHVVQIIRLEVYLINPPTSAALCNDHGMMACHGIAYLHYSYKSYKLYTSYCSATYKSNLSAVLRSARSAQSFFLLFLFCLNKCR